MRAAIIVLALVGAALAVPRKVERIVGGSTTTVEQYPFMSSMQYGLSGILWYHSCGGALITTTAVLSAAQCYFGDSPSEWRVRLGTSLAEAGGSEHYVSKLSVHEFFSFGTMNNDVALVHLSTPAVLSASVNTVSIAGVNYNLPDATELTAVGWGQLWQGGDFLSQLLRLDVTQINQEQCASRYFYLQSQQGSWPTVSIGMLCSGVLDEGQDACRGDSGSPLLHQGNIVVGVSSWGYDCASAYYPGVHARVSVYSNWIVSNV